MDFPVELLANAIVAGLLLGGFYAAVTAGVSIAFGILDIVNIAHPAFIILGSYIAYIVNANFGIDPILVSLITLPAFYVLGAAVYQVYYASFERRGQEALRGLAFFFGLLFITEVGLILVFGVDYRYVEASYIGPTLRFSFIDLPLRMLIPCLVSLLLLACLQLYLTRTFIGRAIMAVAAEPEGTARDARRSVEDQAHRVRHLDRHRGDRRRVPDRDPAGRALGRARIHRPRVRDLRARRHGQPARNLDRGAAARHRREPDGDVLRPVVGARGLLRLPAAHAGVPAGGNLGALDAVVDVPHRHLGARRRDLLRRALPAQRLSVFRRLRGAGISGAGEKQIIV